LPPNIFACASASQTRTLLEETRISLQRQRRGSVVESLNGVEIVDDERATRRRSSSFVRCGSCTAQRDRKVGVERCDTQQNSEDVSLVNPRCEQQGAVISGNSYVAGSEPRRIIPPERGITSATGSPHRKDARCLARVSRLSGGWERSRRAL